MLLRKAKDVRTNKRQAAWRSGGEKVKVRVGAGEGEGEGEGER